VSRTTRMEKAEQKVLEGKYFRTPLAAAEAWSAVSGPMTAQDGRERAGMVVSRTIKHPQTREKHRYYSCGRTLRGTPISVFWPFIALYLQTILRGICGIRGEAFLHTHPSGGGYGASNADRFLLYLPQIRRSFIYDVNRRTILEDTKTLGVTRMQAFNDMIGNSRGTPR